INDGQIASSRKPQEDSRPRFLDLDATRATIRFNVPNMSIGARIDYAQRTGFCAAVSSVEVFCGRVIAHVISVLTKRQAVNELEGVPRVDLAGTVAAVVNK